MARRRRKPPVSDAEEQAKQARVLLSAYAKVFSGIEGEMVLDDLTARFHDHETDAMNSRSGDILPGRLIAAEGQRAVIFHIRRMIEEAEKDGRGESAATRPVEEFDVFGAPKQ